MTPTRAPTPSTRARSRASTVILDGSERGTPAGTPAPPHRQIAMTPPVCTPQGSDVDLALSQTSPVSQLDMPLPDHSAADLTQAMGAGAFQPYQLLMETEITLEYGKKLNERRVMHQELLCCHSTGAQDLFKRAQPLREAYPLANAVRKQLKAFIPPEISSQEFEDEHMEEKVSTHICRIYDRYPLPEYRNTVQQAVDKAIAEQVSKKNVVGPQSKSAVQKRDLKDMGLQLRLKALTSKGVLAVATRVSIKLREIKQDEAKAAETDVMKAAAQRRIILRNYEERVVRSLIHWTYCGGNLTYNDAEHLYALRGLATHLGMKALSQRCLGKLAEETEATINFALAEGLTMQHLLGWSIDVEPAQGEGEKPSPQDNTVQVVFQHVLKDNKPPQRLVNLVVQALAKHLDVELWAHLEHMISHRMSMNLNKAMIMHRQVKSEDGDRVRVKSESMSVGDESVLFAPNE